MNRDFHKVVKDALEVGVPRRQLFLQLKERGLSTRNAMAILKGKNIPYSGYKERMSKRVRDAQKIGKEQGEGDVNKSYFFPREEFLKIEREYRRKSLDPDRPIDKSVIDRVRDLFSETVTPQGETVQTAQVQEIKTPPLPGTPMPNVKTAQANVNPVTNLTATQEALLSPEEKIIAGRT